MKFLSYLKEGLLCWRCRQERTHCHFDVRLCVTCAAVAKIRAGYGL